MAFKPKVKTKILPENPEALFRDLRNRSVEGLLSHQADVLRRYCKQAFKEPNVAIELPTGSGKTLVGLLIAEYRRKTQEERIVYLCPTRQLVKQVVEQSRQKYGIKTTAFTGSRRDYNPVDKTEYLSANTIAVTTYSSLFNTNSFFDNADVIILDDAHAAENYITSYWSVSITRKDHKEIYLALLDIVKESISHAQYERCLIEDVSQNDFEWIDKIPTNQFNKIIDSVITLLDIQTETTSLRHSWSVIRDNLEACHCYINWNSILIRPVIPPSLTHEPFSKAKQRIFMSATLGRGGDLERITGIPKFCRLPIPEGWDKQGIGRRFFLLPEQSLSEEQCLNLVTELIKIPQRTLILVPDDKKVEEISKKVKKDTGYSIFSASDIESSKASFTSANNAVAILANRYDGIDLSGEECRLLIIKGLPKATNLQERFFDSGMAASILLHDRIRTRIVQAVGRCTRSATDYAAICVMGHELLEWFLLKEKRELFHPELQGELKFGIEQSTDATAKELIENLGIFLDHCEEWNEIDLDIVAYRDESSMVNVPGELELFQAAKFEVDYQYAMWKKDYERAVEYGHKILSCLISQQVKGYRGFWHYLTGSAAWFAYQQDDSVYEEIARENFRRAASCTDCVTWFRKLTNFKSNTTSTESEEQYDLNLAWNIESVERLFTRLGTGSTRKLEIEIAFISTNLASNNYKNFEEAQKRLGVLLGYIADNTEGVADPDPWWISADNFCIVFEDKSDGSVDTDVSVKKTRQVASHPSWIRSKITLEQNATIIPIMVTTAKAIDPAALPYTGEVLYWHIDDFRLWANLAMNTIRMLRSKFTSSGDLIWRSNAMKQYKAAKIDPQSIVGMLKELKHIPVAGG